MLAEQKCHIVKAVEKVKPVLGLAKALRYLSISFQQYYAWKNNADCTISYLRLCRRKLPGQLTEAEVNTIRKYMTDPIYQFWSRASVYWQILRDDSGYFAKSTFYKYCKLLGFGRRPGIQKSKKNKPGIIAIAPAEILHTDVTQVMTEDGKANYISFLQDNYSRMILNGSITTTPNAVFVANGIKMATEKYDLLQKQIQLVTDDGSENKGEVEAFLEREAPHICKVIAKVDIPFANNVVEALHKKFKNQILQGRYFANHNSLKNSLQHAIEEYNNRPHDYLFGDTPSEVWGGVKPDKHRFKRQIQAAVEKRRSANRLYRYCVETKN